MTSLTVTLGFAALCVIAAVVVAILAWLTVIAIRGAIRRREEAAITSAVAAYFREQGDLVEAECVGVPDRHGFTLLVESASSKRFRHSHVVELALRERIHKKCGLKLSRVFWRFPIKSAPASRPTAASGHSAHTIDEEIDDYLHEGMVRLKDRRGYEVTDGSLEAYQQAATQQAPPKPGPG